MQNNVIYGAFGQTRAASPAPETTTLTRLDENTPATLSNRIHASLKVLNELAELINEPGLPKEIGDPLLGGRLMAREPRLVFYAEGDDANQYLALIVDAGEAAVIDRIVGGKLMDPDQKGTPWPRDEDDESFFHNDGYTLVFNPRQERVWLYDAPGAAN